MILSFVRILSLRSARGFLSQPHRFVGLSTGDWSDDDADGDVPGPGKAAPESIVDPEKRIRSLEQKLAQARQELVDYRSLVSKSLHVADLVEAVKEGNTPSAPPPARDDDTHYFKSYAANGALCFPLLAAGNQPMADFFLITQISTRS